MGAMPEMKGAGQVTARDGGRYVAVSYPLSMNGDWYLHDNWPSMRLPTRTRSSR